MNWLSRAPAILVAVAFLACASLDRHFAPGLELKEAVYPETWQNPKPISARQALEFTLHSLERRGVCDIRLCQIHWIAAPVGGAIVHATGHWKKDGVDFETFALGIRDGTEAKYGLQGGDEFFVLARGRDAKGAETYYESGQKGYSPRILRYSEIVGDPEKELIFEFTSRDEMAELPGKCSAGRLPRHNLD